MEQKKRDPKDEPKYPREVTPSVYERDVFVGEDGSIVDLHTHEILQKPTKRLA